MWSCLQKVAYNAWEVLGIINANDSDLTYYLTNIFNINIVLFYNNS